VSATELAWVDVAAEGEIRSGHGRVVKAGGTEIAVVNVDGEYLAVENVCSHDFSPMLGDDPEDCDLINGAELICPRHGARFCLRSGDALSAPAYEPISVFPVRVQDGTVQVGVHAK